MGSAYRCTVGEYNVSTTIEKLGHLIAGNAAAGFSTHFHKQTDAWQAELQAVRSLVAYLSATVAGSPKWSLLFEYEIPRRERRPDVILLADDVIFVLEFKVGAELLLGGDEWQVYSYALDLRDFHAESAGRAIVPVLVATSFVDDRSTPDPTADCRASGDVFAVQRTSVQNLGTVVARLHGAMPHDPMRTIVPDAWEHSRYRPTPTIIEAAEQLFAGHAVSDISHAFATNLDRTTDEIVRAIQLSQREKQRTVCFVTGTPGAGKTLTGLNAAHNPALRQEGRPPAIFLSGNGPLVKIVREALVRDKQRAGMHKREASRVVSTFVANVHGFIVHYGVDEQQQAPNEHAIVFDEAQRAWNAEAVLKEHGIDRSEPTLLLQIMERTSDWCAIVALVGGGQEIHNGEAGLEEWGRALNARGVRWRVMASPELLRGGESVAGHKLFDSSISPSLELVESEALHLSVSVRSHRAKLLGQWVDGLLQGSGSLVTHSGMNSEFPVVLTRDLATARRWLKDRSDAEQRAGLLASSGAARLRAYGIEVSPGFRKGYPYADWFLSGPDDTRSSARLEVAATEFECQGLELDWACVCWGDDFLIDPETGQWICRTFRGTKWRAVKRADLRQYLVNKYRVLMTRARRGLVIWVPLGDADDYTREPRLLDATAAYLSARGIANL